MQYNLHHKLGAKFKLVVRKVQDNRISKETGWFNNLVLDSGLAQMSKGTWIDRCCVGTGNTAPSISQTALASFLASTTVVQTSSAGVQATASPYYSYALVTWRFAVGIAAGNISEVGLGWGSTNLWNRSLIKDANGNPTTITVLADEYLDVVSEIRCYPQQNLNGNFNLLDKTGAIISSHTYSGLPRLGGASVDFNQVAINNVFIYTGLLGGVTTPPSGTLLGNSSGSQHSYTYPTNTSIRVVVSFNVSQVNGVHQSINVTGLGLLNGAAGNNGYKIQISPTITKNSTQKMTYTFELSWDRHVA